jgi:hypothetical protein
MVNVQNQGTASFTIAGSLGKGTSSPFTLDVPTTSVSPGGSATVAVMPAQMPAVVAAVPGDFGDTLTITTTAAGDSPHVITLAQGAAGAILAFDNSSIPFGNIPVSASQSAMFTVTNTGNSTAHVTLQSSNAVFAVSPSTSTAVAATSSLSGTLTFSPTNTTPQTGTVTAAIDPQDVLCQPLPAGITATGTGQNGGVLLSTTSLDFGKVDCGSKAASQTFTLTNSGNAPLTYDAPSLGKSPSPYMMSPSTGGSLTAGQAVTFTVTPNAIPTTSTVQPDFYADTITFTTNVIADAAHVVNLHMTAYGSILSFSPASLDFGNVPVTQTGTGSFSIVNAGNATAHVTVASDNSAFGVPFTPTAVTSGTSASVNATFSPGTSTSAQSANVTMAAASADVLCAPLPSAPLTMTGTGTNGSVAYSPASLNFGLVNCGATAPAQTITFTNAGNQSYTITPALGKGAQSPYTLAVAPASGVVAAASGGTPGTATITVTPAAIPSVSSTPGDYGDTLTVSTTVTGDSAHQINLSEGASGAILAFTPTSISFPTTSVGAQSLFSLSVTNSGNSPATINFGSITSPVFTFDQAQVAPGSTSINPNAYFTPAGVQGYAGTAAMTVPAGTALCAPLPTAQISLTGTGIGTSTASVSPSTLDFGHVTCARTPGSKVVKLSNAGVNPFTWTATTGTSYYTVDGVSGTTGASGTLAGGSVVSLTIQPVTIPVSLSTSVAYDYYGDVLTISTTAPNDSPHTVSLVETATGAILSFAPSAVVVNHLAGAKTANFQVRNADSYQAAALTLTLNNPGPASLSLSPTTGSSISGAPMTATVTDTGVLAGSATVSVSASTPLCAPLPQPLQVTAN